MRQPSRVHIAVVVVGGTLAILALAILQIAFPAILGLLGLAAVILIDLGVCLLYRRHRRAASHVPRRGPRYPRVKFGPVDRRYAVRQVDALEREITATALITATFLLINVVSFVLYETTDNFTVFFAAGIMLLATVRILDGLLLTPLSSEAELWDTVEDH